MKKDQQLSDHHDNVSHVHNKDDRWSSLLPSQSVIYASAISGLSSRIILHPIDTIKARLQVQQQQQHRYHANASYYESSMDAIRKMRQQEGIRGFYKGLGASLLFTAPAITLYLTFYDFFNAQFKVFVESGENSGSSGWKLAMSHLTSGFLAETFSCVVWVPHDVLKERLQVNRGEMKMRDVIKMVRSDGLRALYRGYGITLATFGPQSAIYFMSYEYMKKWLKIDEQKASSSSSWSYLISAAVASTVSGVVVCPLDVVKTRMQVQRRAAANFGAGTGGATTYYEGMVHGLRTVYKEEGVRALFKGLGPRIPKSSDTAQVGAKPSP